MNKYILVVLGIVSGALAQIMIKKSSAFNIKELYFFIYIGASGVFYLIAFAMYAYILKIYPLSKISPVMTIGTMIIVILSGLLLFKEVIITKQIVGIILGVIAIICMI